MQWIGGDYSRSAYNEETGKYSIRIYIQDIHNIGKTNAEAAFAEKYGLDYNPSDESGEKSPYDFHAEATKEEIELYARRREVILISFRSKGLEIPFG